MWVKLTSPAAVDRELPRWRLLVVQPSSGPMPLLCH